MASFDPERKRVVIRVVYDGPGHAGKTTNLQRLCKSFASWRRTDLVSPNTIGERTQYFDWLEVDGGILQGYPVRAQLLTVPGQVELRLRRQFVIENADVVVFVSDSQPESVAESRLFYAQLCEQLDSFEHAVPIVLQANKQDVEGALSPRKLATQIAKGLRKPNLVKSAVASNNRGVKQTLSVALRLASEAAKARWKGQDLRTELGDVANAETTLAAIEHGEAEQAKGRSRRAAPPLPSADLPTAQLWPSISARSLLQQLFADGKAKLRRVHFADHPERYCLETRREGQTWRLTTGTDRLYATPRAASDAMRQLANRKLALASWLPEPFATALVPSETNETWLWTIEPVLPTLAAQFELEDQDARRDALLRVCEIALGCEGLAERHGLHIEVNTEAFGLQLDDRLRTRYFGYEARTESEAGESPDIAAPLLELIARFDDDEVALADFTELLCLGLYQIPQDPERRAALRERFARASSSGEPGARLESPGARRVKKSAMIVLKRPAAEPDGSTPGT